MTILEVKEIHVAELDGEPLNPRGMIKDTTDLQASIKEVGLQVPLRVRFLDGKWTLEDGHRRLAAVKALGWKKVEVETLDDDVTTTEALFDRMLASNVRQNLPPLALAKAIKRRSAWGHPVVKTAALCGIKSWRAELLVSLLDAPDAVQQRVNSGDMSLSAWKSLRDQSPEVQEDAAALENPTVRKVRAVVKKEQARGQLDDMLDKLATKNTLIDDLRALKNRILAGWETLTQVEQGQVLSLLVTFREALEAQPAAAGTD